VTLAAWARYESEHKLDRLLRKAEELALAGKVGNGGTRPFGYERDRKTVRPDEAEIIREITRRVLDGEAYRAVITDINRRGIRTPTGRAWTSQAMRRMLC
jgi:site-specific DNA recombinase